MTLPPNTASKNGMKPLTVLCAITVFVALLYGCFYLLCKDLGPRFFKYEQRSPDGTTIYRFPVFETDSAEYASLADHLVSDHIFSRMPPGARQPETNRTPGYPFVLAVIRSLNGGFGWIIPVQAVFVALTSWLLWLIARRFMSDRLALIPAILYAVDPEVILYTFTVMTDILFSLLLVLGVYLLAEKTSDWRRWAASGACMGYAALVRPIGVCLPFVFFAYALLVFGWKRRDQWVMALKKTAIFCIAFLLLIAPWIIRNRAVSGAFGFSSITTYGNLAFAVPRFEYRFHHRDGNEVFLEMLDKLGNPDLFTQQNIAFAREENRVIFPYILADPLNYAAFHLSGSISFFFGSSAKDVVMTLRGRPPERGLVELLTRHQWADAVAASRHFAIYFAESAFWIATVLLALYGAVLRRREPVVILCLILNVYLAFLVGALAMPRYRIPAEGFLFIIAVLGAERVFLNLHARRLRHAQQNA